MSSLKIELYDTNVSTFLALIKTSFSLLDPTHWSVWFVGLVHLIMAFVDYNLHVHDESCILLRLLNKCRIKLEYVHLVGCLFIF